MSMWQMLTGPVTSANTKRGERQRAAAHQRILKVMRAGMPYSTAEIAELTGRRSPGGTLHRLHEMSSSGAIQLRTVPGLGGKTFFHWVKK